MSKFSIADVACVKESRLIDRIFDVLCDGVRLFRVEAYSGNCCGVSILAAVNPYADEADLKAGLKWVSEIDRESRNLPWPMRSFFYYANDSGETYQKNRKAFGMTKVFSFPSRSEPGHDVVQYFVDFGESVNTDDE